MLEDKSAETKALSLSFMGWTVVFSLRIAMEGTLIRRKADFDKTLVSKGSTKSIRRKVGKMLADHKAKLRHKLRQRASMLSYGCPLHVKIYRVINQNLTAGSPLRFASIFLDHHSKSIPHKTADRCR